MVRSSNLCYIARDQTLLTRTTLDPVTIAAPAIPANNAPAPGSLSLPCCCAALVSCEHAVIGAFIIHTFS